MVGGMVVVVEVAKGRGKRDRERICLWNFIGNEVSRHIRLACKSRRCLFDLFRAPTNEY